MAGRITLHPEFGVNPSLDICFWCGEPKGVALLGRNKGREAPRQMVTSYEPCDTCKENFALGILVLEVTPEPQAQGQASLVNDIQAYPTGRHLVLDRSCAMFEDREDILEKGRCLIQVSDFEQILASVKEAEDAGQDPEE